MKTDPTLYAIQPNVLDFGLYKVILTMTFGNPSGDDDDDDLSGFVAVNTTWVRVMPSKLKATIQGKNNNNIL